MAKGFLDIIKKHNGDGSYAGDQHGGAAGSSGSGLPDAKKKGSVSECGLYDLNRKPRPVAAAYRELLKEFGQITIVPHGELFEITDRPARLKVEV